MKIDRQEAGCCAEKESINDSQYFAIVPILNISQMINIVIILTKEEQECILFYSSVVVWMP